MDKLQKKYSQRKKYNTSSTIVIFMNSSNNENRLIKSNKSCPNLMNKTYLDTFKNDNFCKNQDCYSFEYLLSLKQFTNSPIKLYSNKNSYLLGPKPIFKEIRLSYFDFSKIYQSNSVEVDFEGFNFNSFDGNIFDSEENNPSNSIKFIFGEKIACNKENSKYFDDNSNNDSKIFNETIKNVIEYARIETKCSSTTQNNISSKKYFCCWNNKKKIKKREEKTILSTNYTKKSTIYSFKSLIKNDSLSRLKKRRNSQDKTVSIKNNQRCIIY